MTGTLHCRDLTRPNFHYEMNIDLLLSFKVFPEGLMVDMASIFFQAALCPTQLFQ